MSEDIVLEMESAVQESEEVSVVQSVLVVWLREVLVLMQMLHPSQIHTERFLLYEADV
jgi:hypothetical protein